MTHFRSLPMVVALAALTAPAMAQQTRTSTSEFPDGSTVEVLVEQGANQSQVRIRIAKSYPGEAGESVVTEALEIAVTEGRLSQAILDNLLNDPPQHPTMWLEDALLLTNPQQETGGVDLDQLRELMSRLDPDELRGLFNDFSEELGQDLEGRLRDLTRDLDFDDLRGRLEGLVPELGEARKHGNEAAAIGALRTLSTAQSLHREGDRDGNGEYDYAPDLRALGATDLIDRVLASGEKQGYRFELCNGSEAPEFLWMAVAHPIEPGRTGDRWFVTNQAGVTFYSTDGPFELDRETCEIPESALPVGR
jgi:hypothetical protein